MSTTRPAANVSEVLDTFCDTQLIRYLAIASHWTDRLATLPAEDLDRLVNAYQVLAAEAANVAAMKHWLQDPLYRQAVGLKDAA